MSLSGKPKNSPTDAPRWERKYRIIEYIFDGSPPIPSVVGGATHTPQLNVDFARGVVGATHPRHYQPNSNSLDRVKYGLKTCDYR